MIPATLLEKASRRLVTVDRSARLVDAAQAFDRPETLLIIVCDEGGVLRGVGQDLERALVRMHERVRTRRSSRHGKPRLTDISSVRLTCLTTYKSRAPIRATPARDEGTMHAKFR